MKKRRALFLFILDAIFINISYILALYIRFEGNIAGNQFVQYFLRYKDHFIYVTLIKLAIFLYFKLYKPVWKYASVEELMNIVVASIVSNAAVLSYMFIRQSMLPRSIYILAALLDMVLIGGIRFSFRALTTVSAGLHRNGSQKSIMIVGGGDAGAMVIREFKNHTQLNSRPVAIIDDSLEKQGQMINGVPVVGTRVDIPSIAESIKSMK